MSITDQTAGERRTVSICGIEFDLITSPVVPRNAVWIRDAAGATHQFVIRATDPVEEDPNG